MRFPIRAADSIYQLIEEVMSHTRIGHSLPQPLQGLVLSSYLQGFFAVASKPFASATSQLCFDA